MLVAQAGDGVHVLRVGLRVAEEEHEVDLVVGDARADLLRAALRAGQIQRDRQPRRLGNELARGVRGADVVTGENAAVGNAELDHKLLFAVMGEKSDIHALAPPYIFDDLGR